MGNFTTATILIILLNVLMWFTALSMTSVSGNPSICYNVENSIIGQKINQNVVNNTVIDDLPSNIQSDVSGSGGNWATDLFNNIMSWLTGITGIKYLYGVVAAPYNILKCMGLPAEFVAGIGTLWYMVTLFVCLSYLWWRD